MGKKKISIEELSELLEMGTWQEGYSGYIVTEMFSSKDKKIFEVIDLHIETEDDVKYFYDFAGVLAESVLMAVLDSSILSIYHKRINGCLHERINLKDGRVIIDAVKG